jgi:ethanolamine ammonia-lyase small subunit
MKELRGFDLRSYTMARVGIGRAGNSLPTRELLDFQLAHARARDAVHFAVDAELIRRELEAAGWAAIVVHSAARDRSEYLRRPDLGRRLNAESRARLEKLRGEFDAVFAIADGLSALAVHRHAVELLSYLREQIEGKIAPVVIAEQGRVALSDDIGEALNAKLAVMLIGERPGLSSPDSLGAYLTWSPRPGRTDAERNCISNIRPEGMSTAAAAELLVMLMNAARTRQISGVTLSSEIATHGMIE